MTRTNRTMSEPPNLDPLAETESAVRHLHSFERAEMADNSWQVLNRARQAVPTSPAPDYGRAIGWFISLLMFVAVAIPCYFALEHLRATRAAAAAPVPAPATATTTTAANTLQCDPPAQHGDKLVIVITRAGEQLAARCVPITNPNAPERSFKP